MDFVTSQLSEKPDSDHLDSIAAGPTQPWSKVTKIAFRFCFIYFGLFCLLFAQITFAFLGVVTRWLPDQAVMWQMTVLDPVLRWVGSHVFGVEAVLHRDSGSGDQAAIWVMVFCLLVFAAVGTAVWSWVDRQRRDYSRLWALFLTFLRLCVAGQMLFYGFAKLVPTQMPAPPLAALLRQYGDFSPASVLWLQVGSSYPYEMALGAVEVLAGLLLFLPRTATLGALLGVASMVQVFLLNMTFDVPVKILSGHLLLMGLVLLAPQYRRLADFLVLQRPTEPATQPELFTDARANTISARLQAVLGIWMVAGCVVAGWQSWDEFGGGRAKPELYGIWAVGRFDVDGKPAPPLTTDQYRWQRVIFDVPEVVTYQRMNGELVDAPAKVDGNTLTLSAPDGAALATLTTSRPSPQRLQLTGELSGRPVTIWLDQVDLNQFTLRSRGFNWVQEYPYFR
ncbi:putative flippase GtrA [Mycobacterium frederiksbergense]|uniref:Flippase GtrA n=1 Tax=Mycolicibacterium frederiksbergense TaxID=117567 RepID=A0ABT6L7G3_9MYCO|nr:DoxX family protein [Mycolicibacterium frederiksbergense]MDH6198849.1 putative flippase GtrA [Mycolicibacterium frederiksbergense]